MAERSISDRKGGAGERRVGELGHVPIGACYGLRLKVVFALAGRAALYLSQQLGHRHSALTPPAPSSCRITRHPKRMLSRVDESESSLLGGGVAPHPQQAG
jgi:hypothetical protein